MKKNLLTVIIEKTHTGFSCYAKEENGLIAVGDSIQELKNNFNEALYHEIEYQNEINKTNKKITDYEINYVLDIQQFFEYFKVINKTAFAEDYLNINKSLFRQYTKGLAPLSDKKLLDISQGLHKLADEITDITLAV
ncbi:hypothetical protein [Abyssalbus ytuae]|uniref:Uncharacterized protein n=1 Tax=Abyssalbus ytuae TaxID=2926907 RepID=A0A9E7CSP0_9FLAO|nr:hypothetical protein [Abyssalbus ytuae]UOB16586.1 hypothetical protein MQE35_12675 [Abyssalbus ytuae]